MGSSRLPGKSLAEIEGHPMLWHVVQRVERARLVDRVVVATSTNCSRRRHRGDVQAKWRSLLSRQ